MPSPDVEQGLTGEPDESSAEQEGKVKVDKDLDENVQEGVPAGELNPAVAKKKKIRPRKRKLYADVCEQVEFYFSDANISKNRMMLELVTGSEYVNLDQFLGFHKIQKLLPEVSAVCLQKALATSTVLELSPDQTSIKRKDPYDPAKLKTDEEIEQCTIYVENVPTHVDHDWLQKIFQEFGPIAYVAMPKFKHNGLPKGFAFIEFKDKEGAEHCLNAYGDIGARLPENINPEKLLSVRTFEGPDSTSPNTIEESSNSTCASSTAKRDRSSVDEVDGDSDVPTKKPKIEDSESSSPEQPDSTAVENKPNENGDGNNVHNSAEKKKRRRVYKTKKLDNIEKLESDSIQLKILPKKSWRQLRNRYLNLQRENLGKLKKQLRNQNRPKYSKYNSENKDANYEEKVSKPKQVIVKLEFEDSYENSEALKTKLLTDAMHPDFAFILLFVDYDNPNKHAYIRLDGNPEYFQEVGDFLQKTSDNFKSSTVLTEAEAQAFWDEVKLKLRSDPKKKVRGRDKLLQQAMKTATHIRFTDED